MKETITTFSDMAVSKINLLNSSKARYFTVTMMAGFFVGLGVILIYTIGGMLGASGFAGTKLTAW